MNEKDNAEKSLISMDEIRSLLHENAERGFVHTTYLEENRRFHLLMQGDMQAVEDSVRIMDSNLQGTLSKDPLRNMRYLFIVNTGLLTRYAIEAGIPQETVYSVSDLYIQKADVANSIAEIKNLNREIWTTYVRMIQKIKNGTAYSKPIMFCLNYIDSHFNEKITLYDLAEMLEMNPCYLATLFKKEKGETLGAYLLRMRIYTAESLLSRTGYSYAQIAFSLGFCSQSHFTKTFRAETGCTPKEYRMKYYDANISRT
ncbi:MAG: helix-turn-helix transcriptional regulator [Spirochaetaceae bacterium]|nr:helix-turn-helix transcriptional regulator [Spirochaetaceae bacterium]